MKKLLKVKTIKFLAGLLLIVISVGLFNLNSSNTIYAESGFVKRGSDTYYYNPKTGKKVTGLKTINGSIYYFSSKGVMQTGLKTVKNNKYYFSKTSGKALSGLRKISGSKYYFSKTSKKALSGLRTINKDKYYFAKTSKKALSGLRTISGKKYYFDSDTKIAQKGFVTINNNKYYFDEGTYQMVFGTKIIDGKTYKFDEETGILIEDDNEDKTGIIYKNNEPYMYINEDGTQKTGMVTVNNERYYFLYGGGIYKGLRTINNKLYYFTNNQGKAAKGITEVDGDSYYFHPNYSYALSGLHSIFEKTYYFDKNDYKMMKNDTIKVGYLLFTTDKNGLVNDVKPASGYKNNVRANALIEGLKFIGQPYGSKENEFMCNRLAAEVYLAAGNEELVTYYSSNKMYYKPVEVQAEYVLEKGYNKNLTFENLKPGDLIFWDYGPNGPSKHKFNFEGTNYCIGHVSVYLGDGTMLEATGSTWDGGNGHVRVTNFNPSDAKPTYKPVIYASLLP